MAAARWDPLLAREESASRSCVGPGGFVRLGEVCGAGPFYREE